MIMMLNPHFAKFIPNSHINSGQALQAFGVFFGLGYFASLV